MKYPVKTFKANTTGRDFVIGDLHGAYEIFEKLLSNLKFDKSVDRMFSVGDLIDRGPNSLECLKLINESWFHSVLSNHEKMMIDFFSKKPSGAFWNYNGGAWASHVQEIIQTSPGEFDQKTNELLQLNALVEELPFLITVDLLSGKKIHIIHAEMPAGKMVKGEGESALITDSDLIDAETLLKLANRQVFEGESFLWSRRIFGRLNKESATKEEIIKYYYLPPKVPFNDNLSHIISGHTPLAHPVTFLNQTNIDTNVLGAYQKEKNKNYGLTCLELNTWKFHLMTLDAFVEINPIVIKREEIYPITNKFS